MPKKATEVGAMEDSFLYCREKGHHWEHKNDRLTFGARKRVSEAERSWMCRNCTTTMTEVISVPDFQIVRRKYDYPDNYLADVPAMGGRMLRPDVRREQFSRAGLKF